MESRPDGLVTPVGTANGWRRLIYVQQLRKKLLTHMENFDFPQMNPNCVERRDSLAAPQALHLMNNAMVLDLAEHFAARVKADAGPDPMKQIERVYWIALSRSPESEEMQLGAEALSQLTADWNRQAAATGSTNSDAAQSSALAAYCHAILNSAGFLYID